MEVTLSEALFVLELEHGGGVEHQPSHIEEETADNGELGRVVLMRLVHVLVIELNQLDALILLQGGELLKLLAEEEKPKLHWRFTVIVVKVLDEAPLALPIGLEVVNNVVPLVAPETLVVRGVARVRCDLDLLVLVASFEFLLICLLHEEVNGLLVENTVSWAKEVSTDKTTHTSKHVDVSCTSCIMEVDGGKPSVSKDPGGSDGINQGGHQRSVNDVGINESPLGETSRHDGGTC